MQRAVACGYRTGPCSGSRRIRNRERVEVARVGTDMAIVMGQVVEHLACPTRGKPCVCWPLNQSLGDKSIELESIIDVTAVCPV